MADPTYIGVPLPEYEKRIESPSRDTSGGTTTTEISPEQKAAEAKRDENLADEEARVAKETELKNRSSDIDTNKANDLYLEAANQAELDRVAHEKSDADIAAARENIKTKQAAFDKMHPSGLFHENDTWGNVLRGFGAATAGIGDSIQRAAAIRAGHAAPTIDTVGDIISNDLAKQRIQIDKLKDSVVQAHTGLSDANEARAQMMADRHQAAATAYDRLIRLAAAKQAALGKDNNAINASEEIAKLRDKRNKELAEVAAPTGRKVESHFANKGQQNAETFRNATQSPQQTPKLITDTMGGPDLNVDPTRTDARQHNTAVGNLPNINGAIKILDSVQAGSQKQHAPEWMKYIGVDDSRAQAGLNGEMTRFRSAYAAAKKESVGEANAHELAAAIPDPPSFLAPTESWDAWRQKIADTRKEMYDMRREHLALAGVPPAEIAADEARSNEAPAPHKAQPAAAPAPTQPPPFVPQTPAQTTKNAQPGTDKLQAIQLLKTGKISAGLAPTLKKRFGITDEDLR